MGLYTLFASTLLFPLHERLKHHDSVRRRRELESSQWLDRAELRALQLRNLQRFVQRLYRDNDYYRGVMDASGFSPDDIRSLADLRRFPFLTKPLIRDNVEALKTRGCGPLSRFNTGGSTGEPLVFYLGNERVSHDVAAKWRATRWWDVDIGDPEIVIWGSPVELGAQDRVRALRDRLLRSKLIPAFEMSAENLDRFIAEIRAMRPRMLFGYPSSMALIAERAESQGIAMDGLGIKVCFVTSERLYDNQRELIERVFGAPVANGYGGRDAGFIAHQCPSGGMHLSAEDILVEIVGPDGEVLPAGQAGEVVVTHLATGEFPFVRYRTGDVAVLDDSQCACGRGLPMLKEIQGRTTDFIVAPDGTIMHGLALIYILRDLPEVALFKIIQETAARYRIQVVPGAGYGDEHTGTIRAGLRKRLGPDADIVIDLVDDIPRERSGKFRYVVNQFV
ncbi:MAG: phenylacetate--CoA ligase family protein [Gammaproteobacteria bacterium]|nr:phenylacetate--CoA ligase family protein [Gammaproteobacteria bacterium]